MNWWKRQTTRRLALLLVVVAAPTVWACGPFFYNWLLTGSSQVMTVAPFADFERELKPLIPAPGTLRHVPRDDDDWFGTKQSVVMDLKDLNAALVQSAASGDEVKRILGEYAGNRRKLETLAKEYQDWLEKDLASPPPAPSPPLQLAAVAGLPEEFQRYFAGAVAWHLGNVAEARRHWQSVLQLPAQSRRYKTTWASFMLGKAAMKDAPDEARRNFQQVRAQAQAGYLDSLGLAAASFGWEAKVNLEARDFARAIHLYLEQNASGEDSTSLSSLRFTIARASQGSREELIALARNDEARRVITAWHVSLSSWTDEAYPDDRPARALAWLEAVEAAGITRDSNMEQLALAAYRSGDMATARRWLERAPEDSLTTQWLAAKVAVQAGDLDSAARHYNRVIHDFPAAFAQPMSAKSGTYLDQLRDGEYAYEFETSQATRLLAAEVALLKLKRRDFTEAMDLLLRSGYWMDGAYLAERVLETDELKAYVDRHWPEGKVVEADWEHTAWGPNAEEPVIRQSIRSLLGRRLMREERQAEARPYLLPDLREKARSLAANLAAGKAQKDLRALQTAARLMRHNGMQLLGTELDPDFAVFDGAYELEDFPSGRAEQSGDPVLAMSREEQQRVARHSVAHEARYHYRYLAADLAWEAAGRMKDNTRELALWLCEAGGWLKNADPVAADRFYKALVRRCGKTDIGQAADKKRWFPELTPEGKLVQP